MKIRCFYKKPIAECGFGVWRSKEPSGDDFQMWRREGQALAGFLEEVALGWAGRMDVLWEVLMVEENGGQKEGMPGESPAFCYGSSTRSEKKQDRL